MPTMPELVVEQDSRLGKPVLEKLSLLYGADRSAAILERLNQIIRKYRLELSAADAIERKRIELDQTAMVLITYGDQFWSDSTKPFHNLIAFAQDYLRGLFSTIHLLPFYPYSSDDGFAVIDYFQVNPAWGEWADLRELAHDFALMYDAVLNHISAQSQWFQAYLQGDPDYGEFFIAIPQDTDLSLVRRPRTLPLLSPFVTGQGLRYLWTTFSADQIDLNYRNEAVLFKMVELLLFYVAKGATLIRLDAIGYLWKEVGTSCLNLPQTHTMVQLFRDVLKAVDPRLILLTETNVPHRENLDYFGNGANEAQMVYQFALPPLVMHALQQGTAVYLTNWARELKQLSPQTAYFNILATHDGVGLLAVQEILPETAIRQLVILTEQRGGGVSYKNNSDGTKSPYELNITFFDALTIPGEAPKVSVKRFLTAHAILFALAGVPGVYINNLLGSRNNYAGVEQTQQWRTINREKFNLDRLRQELAEDGSPRQKVYTGIAHLIKLRGQRKALHPQGAQTVLNIHKKIFALFRVSPDRLEKLLCLHNISPDRLEVTLNLVQLDLDTGHPYGDLISGQIFQPAPGGRLHCALESYQTVWLALL